MSRPLQRKLIEILDSIDDTLNRDEIRLPFQVAVDTGNDLKFAKRAANEISEFIALANDAMEALKGLMSNWPDTSVVGRYEPENRPVLMKDKAIDQACEVLKKYREIEGDFTW